MIFNRIFNRIFGTRWTYTTERAITSGLIFGATVAVSTVLFWGLYFAFTGRANNAVQFLSQVKNTVIFSLWVVWTLCWAGLYLYADYTLFSGAAAQWWAKIARAVTVLFNTSNSAIWFWIVWLRTIEGTPGLSYIQQSKYWTAVVAIHNSPFFELAILAIAWYLGVAIVRGAKYNWKAIVAFIAGESILIMFLVTHLPPTFRFRYETVAVLGVSVLIDSYREFHKRTHEEDSEGYLEIVAIKRRKELVTVTTFFVGFGLLNLYLLNQFPVSSADGTMFQITYYSLPLVAVGITVSARLLRTF